MACNPKEAKGTVHSKLCDLKYPYKDVTPGTNKERKATRASDCTLSAWVPKDKVRQSLGLEANMDLVTVEDFGNKMPDTAKFGNYTKLKDSKHFCVDWATRTVDGKRLGWLWVYPDGIVKPSNKVVDEKPFAVWTKAEVLAAWKASKELSVFTRHTEIFSELVIGFCLPSPK